MCLEDIGVVEVAHATAAPVEGVVTRHVGHEPPEVLNPRVVLVPVEQINHLVVALLRDIQRIARLPIVIIEAEDVDGDSQLVLDCRDIFDGDWVWDVVEFKLMEEVVVVVWAVGVLGS